MHNSHCTVVKLGKLVDHSHSAGKCDAQVHNDKLRALLTCCMLNSCCLACLKADYASGIVVTHCMLCQAMAPLASIGTPLLQLLCLISRPVAPGL